MQFGIIPTQLAISVLVCVIVLLTAPAHAGARGDQERWRYEISWTEAQRRAMIVRRMMDEDADAESSDSEGAARGLGAISAALRRLSAGGHAVHADAHAVLRAVLRIDRAPGTAAASPARALFCVETLIKMIYFAKLAYQIDVRVEGGGCAVGCGIARMVAVSVASAVSGSSGLQLLLPLPLS